MSTHIPHLANCEEAFELSPIPVWVLDVESLRVAWANAVALEFWRASSLEELTQRDMLDKAPEPVLVRLRQTIARIRAGEVFHEDWTFVPGGIPKPMLLHLRAIVLRDGRVAMLNQALNIEEAASESILRTLVMVRHAKATTVFVDDFGTILAQNPGAIAEFGRTESWIGWLEDPEVAREIVRDALAGNVLDREINVRSLRGNRVHAIVAHGLRDPATGKIGVLIQHFDVTERVEAERLVQTHLSTLREHQREILSLSTPFLNVGANTLALPLIGRIDEQRAAEIMSRLLDIVANQGIERVILDITGGISVDSSSIAFIRRLADAVVLLGAKPIVTGIRADLARTLATSDENLSGIIIKHSLADGMAVWRSSRVDLMKKVFRP